MRGGSTYEVAGSDNDVENRDSNAAGYACAAHVISGASVLFLYNIIS